MYPRSCFGNCFPLPKISAVRALWEQPFVSTVKEQNETCWHPARHRVFSSTFILHVSRKISQLILVTSCFDISRLGSTNRWSEFLHLYASWNPDDKWVRIMLRCHHNEEFLFHGTCREFMKYCNVSYSFPSDLEISSEWCFILAPSQIMWIILGTVTVTLTDRLTLCVCCYRSQK